MQKPCPGADSGAINERIDQVEEVVGKLLNDISVVKNKQNAMKEDLTDNRQYTTSKYHTLRVDTNDNLEAADTKYHALRQSYEELSETLDNRTKISGATYVRWGRTLVRLTPNRYTLDMPEGRIIPIRELLCQCCVFLWIHSGICIVTV